MHPIRIDAAKGPRIPGYDVLRLIGEGGMGRVYLARQHTLDRIVCIKVIAAPAVKDDSETSIAIQKRFEREARLLATAFHPHVLTILDSGTIPADGRPFLVTEYIENGDLRRLMREGRELPLHQIREILRQLGQALLHLHGLGILHRDLKPENILTPSDSLVKLADFGLAVFQKDAGNLTQSSRGIGSLVYAAPEQQTGGAVDARSDQYSLAAVAYEMVTGRRPVGAFPPPSEINPALRPELDAALMKALSQGPKDRYDGLAGFLKDLDQGLAPASGIRVPWFAAISLFLATVVGAWWWLGRRDAGPAPVPQTQKQQDRPLPKLLHQLTAIRAKELWILQGSPTGKAGEAASVDNWLRAEKEVGKEVSDRAFALWVDQGRPSGEAGAKVADPNMRRAASELLKEAQARHPDWD